MTIDQKALEAAREAFTERVLPLGKQLERAITAYLAALPASDHNDETRKFIAAVELVENAGWVVMRPEKVPAASDHAGLVERLRTAVQLATSMGARGQHASNIYNLAEEAATVIQTLEEQIDQWDAWAEGLTPAEIGNGMAKREARINALEGALRPFADKPDGATRWKRHPLSIEGLRAIAAKQFGVNDPELCAELASEILSLRQSHSTGAVAWEGYWPGAGSIDSQTSLTRFKKTADEWQAGGAEITPLYTHPKEAEVTVTEEMVNKYRRGIYVASKVAHAEMWRDLRHFEQEPIISTWIDEAGVGASASLEDLWRRCVQEASNAGALIIYRRSEEVLKGAWVELGAALSRGVPVFAVGIEEFTVANHKGITHCESLIDARRLARAALVAALSRKG